MKKATGKEEEESKGIEEEKWCREKEEGERRIMDWAPRQIM